MHNHSFGDYLLENEYITSEQFLEALQELKLDSRPSFEVCGLYDRTVTYETFEALMDKPEYPKMSIRELAVKYGIITPQIIEIVESQHYPLFVALAQILLSKGYLDYRSCQEAFLDYESESELYEFEADEVVSGDTEGIIEQLCSGLSDANDVVTRLFFKLMFENLYENIGHDFTILDPFECNEYPTNILVSQDIIRDDMTYTFAIDLNKTTLLGFAERFSDMEFTEVDDYSIAAVEDFINLLSTGKQLAKLQFGKTGTDYVFVNLCELRVKVVGLHDLALHFLPAQLSCRFQTVQSGDKGMVCRDGDRVHHTNLPDTFHHRLDGFRRHLAPSLVYFDFIDIE